jgi:hypothetical protein
MLVALFLFSQLSWAQALPDLSDAKVALSKAEGNEAEVGSAAVSRLGKGPRQVARVASRSIGSQKIQFVVLGAAVYAAAFADMHQTLQVRHYSWWYETDPLARPFAKLPSPAYYATGFALATGVNWLSWKMGHSRKWHRLAPLPQLLAIAGNAYGFKSNCYQNY